MWTGLPGAAHGRHAAQDRCSLYTEGETEARRGQQGTLPNMPELGRGRAGIQTQVAWCQTPSLTTTLHGLRAVGTGMALPRAADVFVDLWSSVGVVGLVATQPQTGCLPARRLTLSFLSSSKGLQLSGRHSLPALLGCHPSGASVSAKVTVPWPP